VFTYLLLHVLLGLSGGATLRYLRSRRARSKRSAWLGYGAGLGAMLVLAAAIGQYQAVSETWIYLGTALFAAAFLSLRS
jgi:hypothetical protein